MPPLFSVVIPSFNRLPLLKHTLESVFAQRCNDYEIIVVDDGSTDGTVEFLQSLNANLEFARQANRGAGAARNLGARKAKGRYIAFLDSDDLWFPWTLSTYREAIHIYDFPSFIAGEPFVFSQLNELEAVVQNASMSRLFSDYLSSSVAWRWWGGASAFVVRREAFFEVDGFTEQVGINDEDTDLTIRLGISEGFVQITQPATFAYRKHSLNVSKDHIKLLTGTWSRIRTEVAGHYPGGQARATERYRILTRHIRPITVGCIKLGLVREAWSLYFATFYWNAALWRVKYLGGFVCVATWGSICHGGRVLWRYLTERV